MSRKLASAVASLALVAASCGGDAATTSPTTTTVAPPTTTSVATTAPPTSDTESVGWSLVADGAPWGGRAGLRVVELDDALFVLGGRTPKDSEVPGDSIIWGDVWRSDDDGASWTEVDLGDDTATWPARAYFQAVTMGGEIFVIGGQDFGLEANPFCALLEQGIAPPPGLGIDPDAPCPEFVPTSNFFNDVWASSDGITWEQRTAAAPWAGRAGLSAVALDDALYVFGGSQNDDSSIIGANGPERVYYNDVWRSADGVDWEELTAAAPWEPRAGASTLVRNGEIWLFGGEDGFTCSPLPDCDAPYFNDVWKTPDGIEWTRVTEAAAWSPRPGHQCELLGEEFVCFGGFGLIENPDDVWRSPDGIEWTLLPGRPWNAAEPADVRYDFDSITIETETGPAILTVGGDRETFDFSDPENYLRVDDDVWRLGP
ncbi:MAG: hypothetical protein R2707_03100 [Acidimicrobiales bacterium]